MYKYTTKLHICEGGAVDKAELINNGESVNQYNEATKKSINVSALADKKDQKIDEMLQEIEDSDFLDMCHKIIEAKYRNVGIRKKTDSSRICGKKRRLPKIAVASIVAALVITLGGGVAWAMLASPLKEYFFKNSNNEEFEQIYTKMNEEYIIGTHTVIFDGLIYEKSLDTAYMSFSAYDAENNPAVFERIYDPDKGNRKDATIDIYSVLSNIPKINLYNGVISLFPFKLGDDEGFIITTYTKNTKIQYFEKSLHIQLKSLDEYYGDDKTMEFLILDKQEIEKLNEEFGKLDPDLGMQTIGDNIIERHTMFSEVHNILKNYGMKEIDYTDFLVQIIEAENIKFNIGRLEARLEYNYAENDFNQFYIIRESGEKYSVKKYYSGDAFSWRIEGMDPGEAYGGGRINEKSKNCIIQFKYDFILKPDEEVSIEIDGKIYK